MVNINEGIVVTIMGMLIVFAVLILLWIILEIMRLIFYRANKKSSNDKAKKDNISIKPMDNKEETKEDEDELIAVLTAAIAASLNQSTYNLKIKSFRRIKQVSSAWNAISRKEQIENKL